MHEQELRTLILETLVEVAPEVDIDILEPRKSFRDQFEIDSVDFLNFILQLEKALNTKIPEVDYPKLSSLEGCLTYLKDFLLKHSSA